MNARVISYVGFSLYNCTETTVQRVWKTSKNQGILFCQICKHPVNGIHCTAMHTVLCQHLPVM